MGVEKPTPLSNCTSLRVPEAIEFAEVLKDVAFKLAPTVDEATPRPTDAAIITKKTFHSLFALRIITYSFNLSDFANAGEKN